MTKKRGINPNYKVGQVIIPISQDIFYQSSRPYWWRDLKNLDGISIPDRRVSAERQDADCLTLRHLAHYETRVSVDDAPVQHEVVLLHFPIERGSTDAEFPRTFGEVAVAFPDHL